MRYQWATATHTGMVRSNNQDAVYPEAAGQADEKALLMVADGMGGHVAGEVASRIAVDTAADIPGTPGWRVMGANHAILQEVYEKPHLTGMGTTLTLVELEPEGVGKFAHVGDSRAYLLRQGTLRQLTQDHTVVAEYLAEGKISPDEVASHPQRSMLTRALGLIQDLEIDEFDQPLQPGDRLLLCSDGINSMLDDEALAPLLGTGTPEEAVWALVEGANAAGGHDNITALVVDVEE